MPEKRLKRTREAYVDKAKTPSVKSESSPEKSKKEQSDGTSK